MLRFLVWALLRSLLTSILFKCIVQLLFRKRGVGGWQAIWLREVAKAVPLQGTWRAPATFRFTPTPTQGCAKEARRTREAYQRVAERERLCTQQMNQSNETMTARTEEHDGPKGRLAKLVADFFFAGVSLRRIQRCQRLLSSKLTHVFQRILISIISTQVHLCRGVQMSIICNSYQIASCELWAPFPFPDSRVGLWVTLILGGP